MVGQVDMQNPLVREEFFAELAKIFFPVLQERGFDHLESKGNDSLDLFEASVAALRKILEEAYITGHTNGYAECLIDHMD